MESSLPVTEQINNTLFCLNKEREKRREKYWALGNLLVKKIYKLELVMKNHDLYISKSLQKI